MSHRASQTPAGATQYSAGSSASANPVTNAFYSQSSSKIVAFNGHAIEVYADNSVWDTVLNRYLYPGTEFNVTP